MVLESVSTLKYFVDFSIEITQNLHQFYLKMGKKNPIKYDRNNYNRNYYYCYYKSEVAEVTSAVISQRDK